MLTVWDRLDVRCTLGFGVPQSGAFLSWKGKLLFIFLQIIGQFEVLCLFSAFGEETKVSRAKLI